LATLGFEIRDIDDFRAAIAKVRALIGPLAIDLLRMGVSVVFDFGGNTVAHRAWVRTLFESAGADHVLHLLEATDDECLAAIHRRNAEQPPGLYYGPVSDEIFHAVTAHFTPPHPDEGFHVAPRLRS
jgi:predicted kinase